MKVPIRVYFSENDKFVTQLLEDHIVTLQKEQSFSFSIHFDSEMNKTIQGKLNPDIF